MDAKSGKNSKQVVGMMMNSCDDQEEEMMIEDLRRGPWTVEEDFALMNHISRHGEGRWNSLARSAGICQTCTHIKIRHYHNI